MDNNASEYQSEYALIQYSEATLGSYVALNVLQGRGLAVQKGYTQLSLMEKILVAIEDGYDLGYEPAMVVGSRTEGIIFLKRSTPTQ
jgi:hypothetical protein